MKQSRELKFFKLLVVTNVLSMPLALYEIDGASCRLFQK